MSNDLNRSLRLSALCNIFTRVTRITSGLGKLEVAPVAISNGQVNVSSVAFTDGNKIFVHEDWWIETCRFYSNKESISILRGIIYHELGHVLHSPFGELFRSVIAEICGKATGRGVSLVNAQSNAAKLFGILEEGRVERLLLRQWPSMRKWIAAAVATLTNTYAKELGLDPNSRVKELEMILLLSCRSGVSSDLIESVIDTFPDDDHRRSLRTIVQLIDKHHSLSEMSLIADSVVRIASEIEKINRIFVTRRIGDIDPLSKSEEQYDKGLSRIAKSLDDADNAESERKSKEDHHDSGADSDADADDSAGDSDGNGDGDSNGDGKSDSDTESSDGDGDGDGDGYGDSQSQQISTNASPSQSYSGNQIKSIRSLVNELVDEALDECLGSEQETEEFKSINDAALRLVNDGKVVIAPNGDHVSSLESVNTEMALLVRKLTTRFNPLVADNDAYWERNTNSGRLNVRTVVGLGGKRSVDVFDRWREDREQDSSFEIVVCIDISGSMGVASHLVSQDAWAIKRMSDELGQPCTVMAYDHAMSYVYEPYERAQVTAYKLFPPQGNTVIDRCVVNAHSILSNSQRVNRLFLVMTDGQFPINEDASMRLQSLRSAGVDTSLMILDYRSDSQFSPRLLDIRREMIKRFNETVVTSDHTQLVALCDRFIKKSIEGR